MKGAAGGGGLDVWGGYKSGSDSYPALTPRRVCASGVKQSVVSVVVCHHVTKKFENGRFRG